MKLQKLKDDFRIVRIISEDEFARFIKINTTKPREASILLQDPRSYPDRNETKIIGSYRKSAIIRSAELCCCNDLLIYCWSRCEKEDDLNRLIQYNECDPYRKHRNDVAIFSTVGRIKSILYKYLDPFIKHGIFSEDIIHGNVQYYDEKSDYAEKRIRSNNKCGAIQRAFHKTQRYAPEQEYRFVVNLNNCYRLKCLSFYLDSSEYITKYLFLKNTREIIVPFLTTQNNQNRIG